MKSNEINDILTGAFWKKKKAPEDPFHVLIRTILTKPTLKQRILTLKIILKIYLFRIIRYTTIIWVCCNACTYSSTAKNLKFTI
jgi:hypothetical protein